MALYKIIPSLQFLVDILDNCNAISVSNSVSLETVFIAPYEITTECRCL